MNPGAVSRGFFVARVVWGRVRGAGMPLSHAATHRHSIFPCEDRRVYSLSEKTAQTSIVEFPRIILNHPRPALPLSRPCKPSLSPHLVENHSHLFYDNHISTSIFAYSLRIILAKNRGYPTPLSPYNPPE